jgi:peptidoglycan/LPS O-acetylase OafA/YrhL
VERERERVRRSAGRGSSRAGDAASRGARDERTPDERVPDPRRGAERARDERTPDERVPDPRRGAERARDERTPDERVPDPRRGAERAGDGGRAEAGGYDAGRRWNGGARDERRDAGPGGRGDDSSDRGANERTAGPRPRPRTDLPDWYEAPAPTERDRGRDGRGRSGRRAQPDPRADQRWGHDLSDPSELSGWRSPRRPDESRPTGPNGRADHRGRPEGPPPSWRRPDVQSAPVPAPGSVGPDPRLDGPPAPEPVRARTRVLDERWGQRSPAAPPETRPQPGARRDRYGPLGPTAPPPPAPVVEPAWPDDEPGGYDPDLYAEAGPDLRHPDDREPEQARSPRTAADPRPALPRVAAFDGLRAVALLAVLAFHQGFELARGGFLGLSSFFTLSGFLVATIALAEWAQHGQLAVGRFWERRARRILPALFLTVAAVVALQVTLRVGAGPRYRGDVLAALGQVLNWRYVFDGAGFARVLTDPSPVQHLWSLSLLVQLTLVLPLLFVGLMKLTRARWRAAGAGFALLAIASFAAAWYTAGRSGNDGAAYFGTHTRAGELLVGVVLAYAVLSPRVRRVVGSPGGAAALRFGTPAALVALLWLWSTTGLYSTNLFGGVTAVNAVLTAWVIFAVTLPGRVSDALGSRPLRWLGAVSFAAYLVHWPLFLLLDEDRLGFGGPLLFVVRVAATLAAAAAVTYGFERPLRRARLPRPRLAMALVLVGLVVGAAAFALPQQPPRGVSLTIDDGNGAGDLDVVAPAGDEAASIAVVGGSLAGSLTPGFEAWNADQPDQGVRVATHVATDCPLSGPGPVRLAGETVGEDTACVGFGPRLPRLLDAAEPDVIVVVPGVGDLGEREIDRLWVHAGDPVYDTWLRQHLDDLADTLSEAGVPVVWATTPHVRLAPAGEGDWTSVDANDPARVDRLNEIVRQVASDRRDMSVVDLGAWAQRLPRGEFAPGQRADGRDLTEDGAVRAADWLVPALFEVLGIPVEEESPDPAATPPVDPAAAPPVDPAAAVPVDPALDPTAAP